MEHVIVRFPTRRLVYINGKKNGHTNESLRVQTGTHVFTLGPYKNYHPDSQKIAVVNTTVLDPMQIVFTKKAKRG